MSITGNIRKALFVSIWSLAGAAVLVLLIAAIKSRNNKTCKGYEITIDGSAGKSFIDKQEIVRVITSNGDEKLTGKTMQSFDLRKMEQDLGKDPWVKKSQLFFDNNEILRIHILVREPAARVFTVGGNSFYIDSSGMEMPLNPKAFARIPVFTDYPYEKIRTHGADSLLLDQIKKIGSYIRNDSFWTAEIEQIEITPRKTFEMIPVIGNHLIEFGEGDNCSNKFRRLFLFYEKVLTKTGFDKYAKIDISFEGQVIGTKKGSGITKADSLHAIKNIQQLIKSARQMQADTMRQQNIRPLENNTETEQTLTNYDLIPNNGDSLQAESMPKSRLTGEKPVGKPNSIKVKQATIAIKPNLKKPVGPNKSMKTLKPKAVMPVKNE